MTDIEYRVTEAGLIAWVRHTDEGGEAWKNFHSDSIEDYLADYSDYEGILDLLANDIGYPGDKESNAPGSDIDEYTLLLNLSQDGKYSLSAELTYTLSNLDEEERVAKGDEVGKIQAKSLTEALTKVVNEYPKNGAISTLSRNALSALQT